MASELVELLRRYSNRQDLLEPLVDVLRRIRENDQTDEPGLDGPYRTAEPPKSFAEQLTTEGIENLVAAYRAGMTGAELATKYGVSLSTVRRLLRKHGGRLTDMPPT